jgi:putative hydrolase of the HAD superfamily
VAADRRIAAITIDFWNTLFDDANGPARREERRVALVAELAAEGHAPTPEALDEAAHAAQRHFQHHWLEHRRTPVARELVEVTLGELGAALPPSALDRLATVFARGVLNHPPGLMPGAADALAALSARARLALISDTAFSPGAVLRELMEREGVARHFSAFVFSDETGVAKPEPEAFALALGVLGGDPAAAVHIGDIERTDIAGARAHGMRAILFRNVAHRHALAEDDTQADAVVEHWRDVAGVLERLERG